MAAQGAPMSQSSSPKNLNAYGYSNSSSGAEQQHNAPKSGIRAHREPARDEVRTILVIIDN